MARAERFLFDLDFDEPPAPPPAEAPEPEEAPPPPSFSEEELAAARAEGVSAGLQQGRAEAAASLEQANAETLGAIRAGIDNLFQSVERRSEAAEQASLEAAVALVRTLFPRLAERHGLDEIEAVIAECLQQLREEPRIVVRIGGQTLDPIRARIDALAGDLGYEGRIVLLTEPGFQAGDVKVEWADGGAERSGRQLWAGVESRLARALRHAPPAGDTAARGPAAPEPELSTTAVHQES